jgi:hypothetical protein
MRAINTRQLHLDTQILKHKTVGSKVLVRSLEGIFHVEFVGLPLPNVSHSTQQSDSSEMLSQIRYDPRVDYLLLLMIERVSRSCYRITCPPKHIHTYTHTHTHTHT